MRGTNLNFYNGYMVNNNITRKQEEPVANWNLWSTKKETEENICSPEISRILLPTQFVFAIVLHEFQLLTQNICF